MLQVSVLFGAWQIAMLPGRMGHMADQCQQGRQGAAVQIWHFDD